MNFESPKKDIWNDAYLHFENGTTFTGKINRSRDDSHVKDGIWGEAAFTSGMSGYVETITDPSFLGQHIIFSHPEIGSYEDQDQKRMQSDHCHAVSIIARRFTLNKFFKNPFFSSKVPLFTVNDSRRLVKFITTNKKSTKSVITFSQIAPALTEFKNKQLITNRLDLVSSSSSQVIIPGNNPIVLIDYGVKKSIIDQLKSLKLPLVIVPHSTKSSDILHFKPRMIFLSNGPGDPNAYIQELQVLKELLPFKIPMRAICLGHQLMALLLGIKVIKLPFGQRGINHPIYDHQNKKVLISSQNHGYTVDLTSFNEKKENNILNMSLFISYTSLFDYSLEGFSSTNHFLKTVQFHPEANPGPSDFHFFFEEIRSYLNHKHAPLVDPTKLSSKTFFDKRIPKKTLYKKILLIGSGPIKIGQASEFDYSGTQALKALKEEGIQVVLLNSNPATIMTDPAMCYRTYIEPINKETIKKIILKEKVDAVLSTMGGQTALNLCIELEEEHFLKNNGVQLLGANIDTIKKTEDRALFALELKKLNYKAGTRFVAYNKETAIALAMDKVQFPLIIRRDFALGGKGAALVYSTEELKTVLEQDVKYPITMEKSLVGQKEIELEVMVDSVKNGVIVCSIENIDPCGVHTGDSITVAPALTISDHCLQRLRTMALEIAIHMGVVAGGANVQFAINPDDENDITVIEMNPRVSRSSALASKATGYPIAKISALLSIGHTLDEIINDITKISPVSFEPTLDYIAIKIPLFPFNKFPASSKILGPQMRSVGEVLALGGSFIESFFKALRSLEMGLELPYLSQLNSTPLDFDIHYLKNRLQIPHELSLLTALEAIRAGLSIQEIHELSKISKWFLEQLLTIVEIENKLSGHEFQDTSEMEALLIEAKKLGLSDKHLAFLLNRSQKEILKFRFDHQIFPVYKAVDTCSGEFSAETPYFYSTYGEENEAIPLKNKGRSIAILGSGPNRIGQGIEFDYSCVKSAERLHELNIQSIMINSNPETVSTDYDSSTRLYLSPLYSEDLFDILRHENPEGIIASFSGQTGIALREHLEQSFRKEFFHCPFLGPQYSDIEITEDRKLFNNLTKDTQLSNTKSKVVTGHKNLTNAIIEIGFPVIIRPSYVIGGESMYIFEKHEDLKNVPPTLKKMLESNVAHFLVENYIENAIEYDVDLIRDCEGSIFFTICEHIEYAGVHSGDSGMICPPVILTETLQEEMKIIASTLAHRLNILGPINFQFAVKGQDIYCIEANPRGSRTLPFLSKAYNISLPKIATDALIGLTIKAYALQKKSIFAVKQSTFPFDRFHNDSIILGPKMRSTGETMGIDYDKNKAILKSYQGNYPKIAERGKILLSLADSTKEKVFPYLKSLHHKGMVFVATKGTYDSIQKQGFPCILVSKLKENNQIIDAIKDEQMVMVFNTPTNSGHSQGDGEHIRNTATLFAIPSFTRIENIKAICESLIATQDEDITPLSLQEIFE